MRTTYQLILLICCLAFAFTIRANTFLDSLQNELKKPPNSYSKAKTLLTISEHCEINDIEFYANQLILLSDTILLKETNQLKINDLNSFKAQAYNSIGFMYKYQGVSDKALDNYFKGLKLAELARDTLTTADIYNNLGSVFLLQEDIENAISFSKKAFKLYTKTNNLEGVGIICNNLGDIYQEQKQFEKSLEYHTQSLSVWSKLDNLYFKAISYNNIGVILNKKGQAEKALANYKNSEQIFNILKDSSNLAWTYNLIGRVYLDNTKIELAEKHLTNGYKLATKLDLIELKKYLSQNLFFVYQAKKEYRKALKFYKEYIVINDSLKNESAQKFAIQQMAKYEYEKQKAVDDAEYDKEIAIEQEAKEKQTILTYTTAGGLGLVAIFLLVVFNRLKVTRKQKNIIEEQKTEVEKQKSVVEIAHVELEEKNKEITDSIQYAKRIQNAILPPNKIVKEYLEESFIYYKPKDIVAGDFYWLESIPSSRHAELDSASPKEDIAGQARNDDSVVLFAAADCTGHGVPGAMVSVVCNNGLNRSVREYGLTDPGEILNKTRELVIEEFEKSEEEVKDGMDIALCSLEGNTLQYAGAHNPLWIIRPVRHSAHDAESPNNQITGQARNDEYELIETKANKQPIGQFDNPEPYTTHTIELQKGDSIYIFSDGFADQFGGEKGKKLKTTNFKKLLLSIQKEPMEKQKQLIDEAFEKWKGNLEQLDDVCVIGVKI